MQIRSMVPHTVNLMSRSADAVPSATCQPTDSVSLRSADAAAEAPIGPMEALPYNQKFTGKGVGIAILDTGIAPHPDLKGRLVAFVDAVDGSRRPIDPMGHGTHVAGDAAGSGATSSGRFKGAAPGANIIGIRVLGGGPDGEDVGQAIDSIVSGLDWMVQNKEHYNIRVANLSLGLPMMIGRGGFFGERREILDPIKNAIDRAVDAGIVVVVAAGNDGEKGYKTIDDTPATNPHVITVGAMDNHGSRNRADADVAPFSSRGPTPEGRLKPDVIAPGTNIMSLNAPGSDLEQMNLNQAEMKQHFDSMSDRQLAAFAYKAVMMGALPESILDESVDNLRQALSESFHPHAMAGHLGDTAAYLAMDGTSMASPIVAGICADVIEANPDLTPEQVKAILMKTARPLPHEDKYSQGAGVVDPQAAVELAARMRQYPSGHYPTAASRF